MHKNASLKNSAREKREMEERGHSSNLHVLAVAYPSQGHVNPMLQFCKYLSTKGVKTTLATTNFIFNTFKPKPDGFVEFETISDGFDEGGFAEANSIHEYLLKLQTAGSKTLTDLIIRRRNSTHPIDCVVYDSFLPWALDVAIEFGLVVAPFFTQPCAVNFIYYYVHSGMLTLPVSSPISIPGMPLLEPRDMPSFIYVSGSYPDYFHLVLNQFSNTDKADFVLVNTVYEFESEVVNEMSKQGSIFTIGPTIPSLFQNDKKYGLDLFPTMEDTRSTTQWLENKPKESVIYVSFGSMANLSSSQMEELALGLKESNRNFIWVVRATEKAKIPKGFEEEVAEKGVIVEWSSQVEVLSNEGIGCFFTHCGWNSTLEALCFGVPMVAMPQWTDQTTNAKYVEDVWKVGVRVAVDENGIVGKEEIKACIRTVMEGEKGTELKKNALKWKEVALRALQEGGSSSNDIDQLIDMVKKKMAR